MDAHPISPDTLPFETPIGPGSLVDGFRLKRKLASGSVLRTTYEATADSGESVALTIFKVPLGDRRAERRFSRTVRARSGVRHPGLLPVVASGVTSVGPYLATELPPARTLASLLKEHGRLEPSAAAATLSPVAEALDAALAHGIVPLDLCPDAILVSERDGRGLVGDIGLARSVVASDSFSLLAQAGYSSPEEIRQEPVDARTGVYSLACVFFECLTGAPPFDYSEPALALYGHVSEEPPPATKRNADLPAEIDGILERGLAKERERRFATPGELMQEVAKALPGQPPAVAPPRSPRRRRPAPAAKPRPSGRRARAGLLAVPGGRRTGAAFIAVVAVAIAAGLVTGRTDLAPAEPQPVVGAGVGLTVPADWQRRRTPPALPGFELRQAVGAAPARPAGAGVIAGTLGPTGPSLLPDAFLRGVGRVPERTAVRLGRLHAYRYADLPAANGRRVTVYAVPTTVGVTAVACHAPAPAAAAFMGRCARVAATLRLTGRRAYPLGIDHGYLARLDAALRALRRDRSAARRRLARARGRGRQAVWIARLEGSYATAARQLRRVTAPPQTVRAHASLLSALAGTRRAYHALWRAARLGRPDLYRPARRLVERRERRLAAALRAVTSA